MSKAKKRRKLNQRLVEAGKITPEEARVRNMHSYFDDEMKQLGWKPEDQSKKNNIPEIHVRTLGDFSPKHVEASLSDDDMEETEYSDGVYYDGPIGDISFENDLQEVLYEDVSKAFNQVYDRKILRLPNLPEKDGAPKEYKLFGHYMIGYRHVPVDLIRKKEPKKSKDPFDHLDDYREKFLELDQDSKLFDQMYTYAIVWGRHGDTRFHTIFDRYINNHALEFYNSDLDLDCMLLEIPHEDMSEILGMESDYVLAYSVGEMFSGEWTEICLDIQTCENMPESVPNSNGSEIPNHVYESFLEKDEIVHDVPVEEIQDITDPIEEHEGVQYLDGKVVVPDFDLDDNTPFYLNDELVDDAYLMNTDVVKKYPDRFKQYRLKLRIRAYIKAHSLKKGPTPEEIADPDFNGYWQDESGDWVKYCNPEDLWPDDPELMKYWETFIKREMPLEFVFRAAKTHRSMKSIYYDIRSDWMDSADSLSKERKQFDALVQAYRDECGTNLVLIPEETLDDFRKKAGYQYHKRTAGWYCKEVMKYLKFEDKVYLDESAKRTEAVKQRNRTSFHKPEDFQKSAIKAKKKSYKSGPVKMTKEAKARLLCTTNSELDGLDWKPMDDAVMILQDALDKKGFPIPYEYRPAYEKYRLKHLKGKTVKDEKECRKKFLKKLLDDNKKRKQALKVSKKADQQYLIGSDEYIEDQKKKRAEQADMDERIRQEGFFDMMDSLTDGKWSSSKLGKNFKKKCNEIRKNVAQAITEATGIEVLDTSIDFGPEDFAGDVSLHMYDINQQKRKDQEHEREKALKKYEKRLKDAIRPDEK